VQIAPEPAAEDVDSRAETLPEEKNKVENPSDLAERVLTDSEMRKSDPAIHDLSDDRIERRTSDERVGDEDP